MSYGYIKNVSSRDWNQFCSENMQGKIRSHSQLCAAEGYLHWQIDPLLTISTKGDLSYRPFISALRKWLRAAIKKEIKRSNQKQEAFRIANYHHCVSFCLKSREWTLQSVSIGAPLMLREKAVDKSVRVWGPLCRCAIDFHLKGLSLGADPAFTAHIERGLLASATVAVSSVWG